MNAILYAVNIRSHTRVCTLNCVDTHDTVRVTHVLRTCNVELFAGLHRITIIHNSYVYQFTKALSDYFNDSHQYYVATVQV